MKPQLLDLETLASLLLPLAVLALLWLALWTVL